MSAAAAETLLEEFLKLCVKDGVDDGVESTVDVAEPRHHAHQVWWDVAALTASSHYVKNKERGPAEEKGTCKRRRIIIRKGHQKSPSRLSDGCSLISVQNKQRNCTSRLCFTKNNAKGKLRAKHNPC